VSLSKQVRNDQLDVMLHKQGVFPNCTLPDVYIYIPYDTVSDCLSYQESADINKCILPTYCGHKFIRSAGGQSTLPYLCYGVGLSVPPRVLSQHLMELSHLYPVQRCHWNPVYSQTIKPTLEPSCIEARFSVKIHLPAFYMVLMSTGHYYIPEGLINQYITVSYTSNGYSVREGSNAIITDDTRTCYYTMAQTDFMSGSFGYKFDYPHYFYYPNVSTITISHNDIRYAHYCAERIVNTYPSRFNQHDVFIAPTKIVNVHNKIVDSDIRFFQWCLPSLPSPPADSIIYSIYKGLVFLISFIWSRASLFLSYLFYTAFSAIEALNSRFLLFEFIVIYAIFRQHFTTDVSLILLFFIGFIFGIYRELEPQILALPPRGCSYRGPPVLNRIIATPRGC
jgi:hypothetical protein